MENTIVTEYDRYQNDYISTIRKWQNGNLHLTEWKAYEILWALRERMILWDDIPPDFGDRYELPHRIDYGIDLINLDFTCTGQVKYYNENSTISWRVISTYYTYSRGLLDIHNLRLFTTPQAKIDKTTISLLNKGKEMPENIKKKEIPELLEYALSLPYSNVEQKREVRSIEQRPYTKECTDLFLREDKKIMKYQLPCGIGKSFIIFNIIQMDMREDTTAKYLIVCPWIDLADQMYNDLCELGIPTTLVHSKIKKTTEDNEKNARVFIYVAGSIDKVGKRNFKYVFVDEAHHIEAEDSKVFEKIQTINYKRMLQLSATFKNTDDLDYTMTMRDGIDHGWLSDHVIQLEYFTTKN